MRPRCAPAFPKVASLLPVASKVPGSNDAGPLFTDFYQMEEKRKAGKV